YLKEPEKFQRLGGKIPKGVLLIGPPGTGKTLLARAVAGEADVPFFAISGSDFIEMFVGVGAARVRDLFQQAKQKAPCIIFIDELDAIGRKRSPGAGAGVHEEREQTLNQLLIEMDGFEPNIGVIVMSATNRPDILDQALLRPGRFDRRIVVDNPDLNGREAILKVHAKGVKLAKDVDLKVVAQRTPGFSGADLANVVNEAALLAARKNKNEVEMEDLEEAIDRVLAGPEKKSMVLNPKEKRIVAFHESGHALVADLLPNSDPVHKMSIIPRGWGSLGHTLQLPIEDRYLSTKEELLSKIKVLLGGRIAEEIIFNEISTGAQKDLEKATEIARKMVCEYGMSEKLGPLTYENEAKSYLKYGDREKSYSEETALAIDNEIRDIITDCYNETKKLILENKEALIALAKTVEKKENLEGEEVKKVIEKALSKKEKKRNKLSEQVQLS
ncbi:MAG: ATP-dependent zinc metalloprotease FtsH, partial [Deltaproteobacteria bacterium]|nr:ATP-dependent zinc metalloprotease FtsH [Deltaproteobacteria bacterium]